MPPVVIQAIGEIGISNAHPWWNIVDLDRVDRMAKSFVVNGVQVQLRSEGYGLVHVLGTGVDQCPLLPAEGPSVGMPLNEILLDLRGDGFEKVPEIAQYREIPKVSYGVFGSHYRTRSRPKGPRPETPKGRGVEPADHPNEDDQRQTDRMECLSHGFGWGIAAKVSSLKLYRSS